MACFNVINFINFFNNNTIYLIKDTNNLNIPLFFLKNTLSKIIKNN